MLSNASPSTEVTNFWTVGDTVEISGNMDDQQGPQDDPVNIQSGEGQFESSEIIAEIGQEYDLGPLLFVFSFYCLSV